MSDILFKVLYCANSYAMALIFVIFLAGVIRYLNKIDSQKKIINELKSRIKIENPPVSKTELESHKRKLIEADSICKNILKKMAFFMLIGIIVFAAILSFRIFSKVDANSNDFIYTFSFCMMLLWMAGLTFGLFFMLTGKSDFLQILNSELGVVPKKIMQGYIKLLEEKVESMKMHLLLLEQEERGLTILEAHDMIEGISIVNSAIKAELKEHENITIKK